MPLFIFFLDGDSKGSSGEGPSVASPVACFLFLVAAPAAKVEVEEVEEEVGLLLPPGEAGGVSVELKKE